MLKDYKYIVIRHSYGMYRPRLHTNTKKSMIKLIFIDKVLSKADRAMKNDKNYKIFQYSSASPYNLNNNQRNRRKNSTFPGIFNLYIAFRLFCLLRQISLFCLLFITNKLVGGPTNEHKYISINLPSDLRFC